MLLKDKIIIVAGAAGLLGKDITRSIIKEGANVVAADVSEEKLKESFGSYPEDRVLISPLDITNESSINSLIDITKKKWGAIDGAVNTSYPRSPSYGTPPLDVSYEDFSENVSLHLGGYFLFMKNCVSYAMKNKANFSLVNLSSVYGNIAPRFEIYEGTTMTVPVEYAAIKSAIQSISKYFSTYTKNTQFRVNTVSPGGILDRQPKNFIDAYNQRCRSKGMLSPADICGTITFLLSTQSEFIVSQNITIDDGFCL